MPELLSGPNAVLSALAGRRKVTRVLVAAGSHPDLQRTVLSAARERGVPLQIVPRSQLDARSQERDHQGVLAEAEPYPYVSLDALLASAVGGAEPALFVVADSVQDPQNLGALARTAEVVGAHGLVLPERRAVGVTPAVVRASAGAVEHLSVARVVNLVRAMTQLKEAGLWFFGLEADGDVQYDQADLSPPLAVVVGGEDRGLGRLVRAACDVTVRLPMRGRTGSLNLAVAAGVVLYEVWRQRAGRRAGGAEGRVDSGGQGR